VWTQLASVRTQTFVRMFPRCGIPDVFGTWAAHRSFYRELIETNCIEEFTQIWWSVRPHHRFGTVEVRICDAQAEPWQSLAISSLAVGLIAHLAQVYDEGMPLPILENRYIEENLWRAIRFGLQGKLVDWSMRQEFDAADAVRELVEQAWPQADILGLSPHLSDVERMLREGNGAQQQVRAHLEGADIRDVFAETVRRARVGSLGVAAEDGKEAG
jgi:carboxylate-amine ligase